MPRTNCTVREGLIGKVHVTNRMILSVELASLIDAAIDGINTQNGVRAGCRRIRSGHSSRLLPLINRSAVLVFRMNCPN